MRYIKMIVPKKILNDVEKILKKYNAYSISIVKPIKTSIEDGYIVTCNAKTEDAEKIVLELKKLGLGEKGYGSLIIMPAKITFSCRDEGVSDTKLSKLELFYKAHDMVKISEKTIIKVILATIMGVVGLLENSIPTLIGAMIIAPLVDTVMASAIGSVLKNKELFIKGMKKELYFVFIIIVISFISALIFTFPERILKLYIEESPLILSAIVALVAGISGGISIASGKEYEMIGVTIDVSILLPSILFGLSLATKNLHLIILSFILLIINIILLDVGGYLGILYMIKRKSY
ncbi:TIGR00341 family protein [Methanocaldococcus sp.]